MIRFDQIAKPPANMRGAYLDSLAEPQELHLEMHVDAGMVLWVENFGYAVQCGKKLVELYIVSERASQLVEFFDAVMNASGATSVLCKSYDTQMMYAALSKPAEVQPRGLLFRRIANATFEPRQDVTFRQGTVDDAEAILGFNDDFFQSLGEIENYAAIDGLFVLEKEGTAIGCGIGKPVIADRPDIDIGMLVAAQHRKNGYGAHIISFLKKYYLEQGTRPICGCSIDNIGSQRALRNAGFVSEHRLLEITF